MTQIQTTVAGLVNLFNGLCDKIPHWALAVIARVSVAHVFWQSGQTKVDGFALKESTFVLFETLYKVPLMPPVWAAYYSAVAEHVFPVLLILGLASRLSAVMLLGMTAVIQFFVFPDAWPVHIFWLMSLGYIIARGAGALSLDHLIAKKYS